MYCIAGKVSGHYIWWLLYLVVIIFGGIDRNCISNGLKFDGTQLFDVILIKLTDLTLVVLKPIARPQLLSLGPSSSLGPSLTLNILTLLLHVHEQGILLNIHMVIVSLSSVLSSQYINGHSLKP